MHADRILVVEDGVVTESGRHDELLRHGGRYAAFYRLQLIRQEEPAAPIVEQIKSPTGFDDLRTIRRNRRHDRDRDHAEMTAYLSA